MYSCERWDSEREGERETVRGGRKRGRDSEGREKEKDNEGERVKRVRYVGVLYGGRDRFLLSALLSLVLYY